MKTTIKTTLFAITLIIATTLSSFATDIIQTKVDSKEIIFPAYKHQGTVNDGEQLTVHNKSHIRIEMWSRIGVGVDIYSAKVNIDCDNCVVGVYTPTFRGGLFNKVVYEFRVSPSEWINWHISLPIQHKGNNRLTGDIVRYMEVYAY